MPCTCVNLPGHHLIRCSLSSEKNHLNVENECLVTAEKPKKDIFRTQTTEVVLFVTSLCQ